jgi:hypothetical protein
MEEIQEKIVSKICPNCSVCKPFSDFHKCIGRKHGIAGHCKICVAGLKKIWKEKNPEKYKLSNKNYQQNNKTKIAIYHKENYRINSDVIIAKAKEKRELNKVELAQKRSIQRKIRRKTDPLYKTKELLRKRLWEILKRKKIKKIDKTIDFLGASIEIVKSFIENKFTDGMSWANQGEWHIDHIMPLAKAKTCEEVATLFNYKNLQPLWAIDNFKKSDKWI